MSDSRTTAKNEPPKLRRFQFGVGHLLAGTTAVAIGLAVYGAWGWFGTAHYVLLLVAIWGIVRFCRRRSRVAFGVFLITLGLFGAELVVLPMIQASREYGEYHPSCNYCLKNIALALQNYHADYSSFPPAYVPDKDGKPMHSWRVLLLPYLERRTVYEKYRFDEPWNGPNNRKLALEKPACYSCLVNDPDYCTSGMTSYVAVVGPGTVWPDKSCVRVSQVTDNHAATLMVVESATARVHWMEPRDLDIRTMPAGINPATGIGISSEHQGGAYACCVDGSAVFLPDALPPTVLRELLIHNDGKSPLRPWEYKDR